jgi:hypothetical protein
VTHLLQPMTCLRACTQRAGIHGALQLLLSWLQLHLTSAVLLLLMRCLLLCVCAAAAAHMAWLQLSVSQKGSGCILSLMLLASLMSSICNKTDSASKHQDASAQMRLSRQAQPLFL